MIICLIIAAFHLLFALAFSPAMMKKFTALELTGYRMITTLGGAVATAGGASTAFTYLKSVSYMKPSVILTVLAIVIASTMLGRLLFALLNLKKNQKFSGKAAMGALVTEFTITAIILTISFIVLFVVVKS